MNKILESKLLRYHGKRDFKKTPEPMGVKGLKPNQQLIVQKHFARRMHFDLRLEIDGVLVSWAVTRGPSANPRDKRLAVRTEDHPLSYGTFEGLIPKPQYGGGTVILWEYGTYKPLNGPASKALAEGQIKFEACGHRLKGAWVLVRMNSADKGENWLLIKERDEYAETDDSISVRFEDGVISGLSRDQLETGSKSQTRNRSNDSDRVGLPAFVGPQLCGSQHTVPQGEDWAYEMKYDGYRLIIAVGGGQARIYTRSGLDWTSKFTKLAAAAIRLPVKQCLLDGEAVVFNASGISDFPALVTTLEKKQTGPVSFVAFDLLTLDGQDLTAHSYLKRKLRLQKVMPPSSNIIRYAKHSEGNGEEVFQAATNAGAEGIIAKLKTSPYRSGRTKDWLKIKGDLRDDVEIIGYLPSQKNNSFASLLAAKQIDGRRSFVGRIGTGYNTLNRPQIQRMLEGPEKPNIGVAFANKIPPGAKLIRQPFTAEVRFGGWTADRQMRQARFISVQSDRSTPQKVKLQPVKLKSGVTSKSLWRITHAERILFPDDKITKGDLDAYYNEVKNLILPHIEKRPLSLLRVPESIVSETFFQRHPLKGMTKGIEAFGAEEEKYFALSGEAGLAEAVQFGTVEFHGWNATLPHLDRPDRMTFDLDPDINIPFDRVKSAAITIRDYLRAAKLDSWPLLSGGKGIHVVVPLDRSNISEDVETFCKQFAKRMEAAKPDVFVANMSIAKRKNKIFIDYLRNREKATAIVPWSIRAIRGASLAAPLSWKILEVVTSAQEYHIRKLPPPDLWKKFWNTRQKLSAGVLELLQTSIK